MTFKKYAHVLSDVQQSAAEAMDQVLY